MVFIFLAAIYIISRGLSLLSAKLFRIALARWLTDQFVARWLEKRSYYYLEEFNEQTDKS